MYYRKYFPNRTPATRTPQKVLCSLNNSIATRLESYQSLKDSLTISIKNAISTSNHKQSKIDQKLFKFQEARIKRINNKKQNTKSVCKKNHERLKTFIDIPDIPSKKTSFINTKQCSKKPMNKIFSKNISSMVQQKLDGWSTYE